MRVLLVVALVACIAALPTASANPNGLGRLPPMGWNTWCTLSSCHQPGNFSHAFHDVCNVWMIKSVAQGMIDNGMQAAGYDHINLDDCWEAGERAADGSLQADPERFPDGIAELASWLHDRNFKFGLYLSAGWTTCSTGGRDVPFIPGSIGHYEQDTATVASWGTDYIKLDWCGITNPNNPKDILNQDNATTGFAKAANKTGRAMWLNFHCGHTTGDIPQWCRSDGNSYRIAQDHHDNWPNTIQVINTLKSLGAFARPFSWLDPDFLYPGGAGCDKNVTGMRCPGMTETEYRTTFSLWSMAAASMLISSDPRDLTPFMKSVILNKEIIAVNQDILGVGGGQVAEWDCAAPEGTCQVWARPLSDGSPAAALFNADDDKEHDITLEFSVVPEASWTNATYVLVRDLWAHKDIGVFRGSYTAHVLPHETHMLKLTQIG